MTADADVLVVGAGIAGCSAAWFARRAGRRVTIVDDGAHRASDLPVALINPLRGATGRIVDDGVAGMEASLALVDDLRDRGHAIVGGRGVFRPLVDAPPAAARRPYWQARIGDRLRFDWHDVVPAALGLATPVPALYLPDAGWVGAPSLLAALRAASEATVVTGRITSVSGRGVVLADGRRIVARALLWSAGAWGVASFDESDGNVTAQEGEGAYRPGSLLAIHSDVMRPAMTFGLYAVPWTAGAMLLGPTREGAETRFPAGGTPAAAIDDLRERADRLFAAVGPSHVAWRGVRLVRLSSHATARLRGIATLTAFGSRGFLMAPLRAAEWARSL